MRIRWTLTVLENRRRGEVPFSAERVMHRPGHERLTQEEHEDYRRSRLDQCPDIPRRSDVRGEKSDGCHSAHCQEQRAAGRSTISHTWYPN